LKKSRCNLPAFCIIIDNDGIKLNGGKGKFMEELMNLLQQKKENLEEISSVTSKMKNALLFENVEEFILLLDKRQGLMDISADIDEKISKKGLNASGDEKINIMKKEIYEKVNEIIKTDKEVLNLAKIFLNNIEKKIEDLNLARNVSRKYNSLYDKVNYDEGIFIDKKE